MARFETEGLDELIESLTELDSAVQDVLMKNMLDAGGNAAVKEWKEGIERHGHVDTGTMRDSVRKSKKGDNKRVVYPKGKDSKGVRNAQKAYVLHYGRSNIQGDRFIDEIEEKAEEKVLNAMENKFDKFLRERGLI